MNVLVCFSSHSFFFFSPLLNHFSDFLYFMLNNCYKIGSAPKQAKYILYEKATRKVVEGGEVCSPYQIKYFISKNHILFLSFNHNNHLILTTIQAVLVMFHTVFNSSPKHHSLSKFIISVVVTKIQKGKEWVQLWPRILCTTYNKAQEE